MFFDHCALQSNLAGHCFILFLFQSAAYISLLCHGTFVNKSEQTQTICVSPRVASVTLNSAPVFHSMGFAALSASSMPGFALSPATEWKLEAALCKYLNYVIDVSTVIKETVALPLKYPPASRPVQLCSWTEPCAAGNCPGLHCICLNCLLIL